jgi:hypothetical protein
VAETIRSVEEYIAQLAAALSGADPALVQDATYDASEHLRTAVEARTAAEPAVPAETHLARAVEEYGSPQEVAAAYCETESRVAAALAVPPRRNRSTAEKVFGVFIDPRAYSSLLFMLLALPTGMAYFTWTVTGLSLSLGLSVLIFGLPFFILFVGSVRAIALAEGRLVEALLGIRMPRRPPTAPAGTLWRRIAGWLRDPRTWTTMLYLVLRLPLGVAAFGIFVTLLVLSVALLVAPVVQLFVDVPLLSIGDLEFGLGRWAAPVVWVLGFAVLFATLHLARGAGWLHARLAKVLLAWPARAGAGLPATAVTRPVAGKVGA